MLRAVGLTDLEERAYRALLSVPRLPAAELAEAIEVSEDQADGVIASLEAKGLVSRTTGSDERLVPAPPDVAMEVLLLKRQEELQRARLEIAQLAEDYRAAAHPRRAAELVEVVVGKEATVQRFEQLQRSAREELLLFDKPPYAVTPEAQRRTELDQLAQGVRYRVIYHRQAVESPWVLDEIEQLTAAGEEARVADHVPMKLAVADRSLALVPLSPDQPSMEAGSALVHPCGLLDALTALFDALWAIAVPLRVDAESRPHVDAAPAGIDTQLLSLMLSGLPDQAIARRLGVSDRTVQRRLAALYEAAGVSNRMQLGWHAARQGWIDDPDA